MKNLHKILLIFILAVIFIPIIQGGFKIFKIRDLKGAFTPAENADFSTDSAFTTGYQEKKEKYLNENFGFRNDVHPTNKKVVGERLALLALSKTYFHNIAYSGPEPIAANFKNNKIIITFKHTGGLLKTSDSTILLGFSLDGRNPIPATITKNNIIINTNIKPEFIYYGWQPYSIGNLINQSLLPASTFKISVK